VGDLVLLLKYKVESPGTTTCVVLVTLYHKMCL